MFTFIYIFILKYTLIWLLNIDDSSKWCLETWSSMERVFECMMLFISKQWSWECLYFCHCNIFTSNIECWIFIISAVLVLYLKYCLWMHAYFITHCCVILQPIVRSGNENRMAAKAEHFCLSQIVSYF